MKLKTIFLIIATLFLASCGLDTLEVAVDKLTPDYTPEPIVVTVVVIATPTSDLQTIGVSTPIPQNTPAAPTAQVVEPAPSGTTAGQSDPTINNPPADLPPARWTQIADLPRHINALVANPQKLQQLFAGTGSAGSGSGVYKSDDSGLTWHLSANGLPNEDVLALCFTNSASPILYALVGVRGSVYASTDEAESWILLGNSGLFGGFDHAMIADPVEGKYLIAFAVASDMVRSDDGGRTWIPFGAGLPKDEHTIHVQSLAIDPNQSRVLYAGTGGFVGGGNGVYTSGDGGQTWSAINRGMLDYRITALAVDPNNTLTLFAGADDGAFFKSINGGQTWEDLSNRLPLRRDNYQTIRIITLDSAGRIFLLADRAGVFVSQDGGQTWQALGKPGTAESNFSAVVVVSGSEPFLVIGTKRDGSWLYRQ